MAMKPKPKWGATSQCIWCAMILRRDKYKQDINPGSKEEPFQEGVVYFGLHTLELDNNDRMWRS